MVRADNFKRNGEGYLQEIRVELGGNAGALNISSMSQNRENDGSEIITGSLILSNRRMPNGTYGGVRGE